MTRKRELQTDEKKERSAQALSMKIALMRNELEH